MYFRSGDINKLIINVVMSKKIEMNMAHGDRGFSQQLGAIETSTLVISHAREKWSHAFDRALETVDPFFLVFAATGYNAASHPCFRVPGSNEASSLI